MASEYCAPFSEEDGDYIVLDEVLEGQFESEDENVNFVPTVHDLPCLKNSETGLKTETFSKHELITKRGVSENVELTQYTDTQISVITETELAVTAHDNPITSKVNSLEMEFTTVFDQKGSNEHKGTKNDENGIEEENDNSTKENSEQVTTIEETRQLCTILPEGNTCVTTDQKIIKAVTKDDIDIGKKVDSDEITNTQCVMGIGIFSVKESVKSESNDKNKSEIVESLNVPQTVEVKLIPSKESAAVQSINDIKTEELPCLVEKENVKSESKDDVKTKLQEESIQLKVDDGETKTNKETIKAQSIDSLWNQHELLVRGLPPGEVGVLKKVLNQTLGSRSYRIKPQTKDIAVLRVRFKCKDEMQIAHRLLHNQKLLSYRVTTRMLNKQTKRSAEANQGAREQRTKKMKQDLVLSSFLEGMYKEQIARKMDDVCLRLQDITRQICRSYPEYRALVRQRRLENGGVICCLGNFTSCPASDRFVTWCKFSIGRDKATREPVVGFNAGNGRFRAITSAKHNYPVHVVEAAKVFEKVIRTSTKTSAVLGGKKGQNFWNELIIRTNETQDLMFMVCVCCSEELATSRMTQLHKEMTEFFNSEEGKNCRVTSVYIKVFYNLGLVSEESQLVAGLPYLEQTILGIKVHLLPKVRFEWNNVHACEMICKGVAELLAPTEKTSVLDVFCGQGLIGLYLSKSAGEVLCVDKEFIVEEAKKNAALNKVTNCRYFGGTPDEVIPQLATRMTFDEACAIVVLSFYNTSAICLNVMEELRRIRKLKRVVLLVTQVFSTRFDPIMMLCKPTNEGGMGDPFFPTRIVPVDNMPKSRGYVILILMERIELQSLPKRVIMRHGTRGRGSYSTVSRTNDREARLIRRGTRIKRGVTRVATASWQQKRFFPGRQDSRTVYRSRGRGRLIVSVFRDNTRRPELYQDEEDEGRWLEGEHRRRVQEEECKRRMEEEEKEHRKRIEEEEQNRRIEEEQQRRMEEEEHERLMEERKRRMEEEQQRIKMEEERKRKREEEKRRKLEEENRKRIEEQEQMRLRLEKEQRWLEEEYRIKMEEERRKQVQQDECRRQMQEKFKRHIQEDGKRANIESERWIQGDGPLGKRANIESERWMQGDGKRANIESERWIQGDGPLGKRANIERERWMQGDGKRANIESERWMQGDGKRANIESERWMQGDGPLGKRANIESERWMQGEERGMWMNKEYTRQREMERDPSSNLRSRSDVIHGVIGDTLRGSAVPDYTAQQLKRAIAQAIENAGVFGQEEKRNDSGRTYQPTQPDSQRDRKFENEFQRWPDLHRNSQQFSEMYGTNKRLSEMYGVNRPMSGTDNYQHNRDINQSRLVVQTKLKPRPELLGSSTHQRQDQVPTSSRDFGLYARRDQLIDRPRNSPWNASTMENVRKVESSFPAAVQGHPHNITRRDTSDWTSRGSETMTRQDGTSRGFESGFRNSPYSMQPWDGGSRRTK